MNIKQDYQENTACQIKKKKSNFRFTRQEQIEHTEERKKSWRRRWGKTTIAERKEINTIFPGCNSFEYINNPFCATRNNSPFDLKNNIIYINKQSPSTTPSLSTLLDTVVDEAAGTTPMRQALRGLKATIDHITRRPVTVKTFFTCPKAFSLAKDPQGLYQPTQKVFQKPQKRSNAMIDNNPKVSSGKKLFPKALIIKVQDIWEKAQHDKISLFKAKSILSSFKRDYPEGLDQFNQWYNSSEGLSFRQWITHK